MAPQKQSKELQQCPICLQELQTQPITVTPCNHDFHQQCLKKWQKKFPGSTIFSCPKCRRNVPKKFGSSASTTPGATIRITEGSSGGGGGGGGGGWTNRINRMLSVIRRPLYTPTARRIVDDWIFIPTIRSHLRQGHFSETNIARAIQAYEQSRRESESSRMSGAAVPRTSSPPQRPRRETRQVTVFREALQNLIDEDMDDYEGVVTRAIQIFRHNNSRPRNSST